MALGCAHLGNPWLVSLQSSAIGAGGASADEAHELLFDDDAGHGLHFGEAAGEGDAGLLPTIGAHTPDFSLLAWQRTGFPLAAPSKPRSQIDQKVSARLFPRP